MSAGRLTPVVLAGLLLAALLAVAPLPAAAAPQQPQVDAGGEAEAPPPAPTFPDRSEVGPRYLALADRAAADRRRIAELAEIEALEADLAAAEQRGEALADEVEATLDRPGQSLEDRLALRQSLARHREELGTLAARVSRRIADVDQVRESWLETRELWSGWQRDLEGRGELGEFADDFSRARRLTGEMVEQAEAAVGKLAAAQAPLRRLQESSLELVTRVDEVLVTQRAALLERNAPALLTPGFLADLDDTGRWRAMADTAAGLRLPDRGYFIAEAPGLALQLLLFVAGYLVARNFRRRFPRAEHRWRVLLSHPVAIGLFVASAFSAMIYEAPPPLWRLLLLTVLAASAAVLTSGTFRNPLKRRVAYALAAFFVLVSALETFALPAAGYRLFTLLATGAGLPFLWLTARREEAERGRQTGFARLLYLGALVLAAVLAAQLVGYAVLARWLLENALATAFIAFTAVFLIRLGKGALRAALLQPSVDASGRLISLRRVGHELSSHLARGLEVVLVVVALLYVLTVWGVFPSPLAGWRAVTTAGIELGSYRISVAQVLLGALTVYLAFVVSGVTRALVGEELGRRQDVEPGVADSVSTLAHYALVGVGLLIALAAIGFDLSSFAIIAGALGVGIGFGLQNTVNNFFSSLILLFERPVRVGDVVVIDGQWATIRKIGLRATVVTTFDQAEVIVPNGDLVSEKVTNWTLTDTKTRIVINLGVAYGSDLETVFAILQQVVTEDPRVAEDPPPLVHFDQFGASSLDFVLRIWVPEITERLNVRSDLLRKIDQRFREAGVTIPFPQRDVHLRGEEGGKASGGASAEEVSEEGGEPENGVDGREVRS